jgi:VWFA-related protein
MLTCLALVWLVQQLDQPRYRAGVDLVNISFTVRDARGQLQPSLKQSDFTIKEDGVTQDVRAFSRNLDTPLTLGIILDLSGSQAGFLPKNIAAARKLIQHILQPGDAIFIVAFQRQIRQIEEFSASVTKLEEAIVNVKRRYQSSTTVIGEGKGNYSPIRDALYYTALKRLKDVPSRKALILISDGEDNASATSINDTIEMLQQTDTVVYALDPGIGAMTKIARATSPSMLVYDRLTMRNHLNRIGSETGGRHFKVSSRNLSFVFGEIEEELRTTYTISYVSSNAARDGKWRKVEVNTGLPNGKVQSRPGYRAPVG